MGLGFFVIGPEPRVGSLRFQLDYLGAFFGKVKDASRSAKCGREDLRHSFGVGDP